MMAEFIHEDYMARCIKLAQLGGIATAPNPMVGAVLVHRGKIIGEGYHQKYGEAHAEVNCINTALQNYADKIKEATLYVSLEPCAHFGKTPPCANLIVEQAIPKVVIGCRDSFAAVNGKGIEKLKAANIEVIENVLKDECIALNKRFFTYHQLQRPYIILKWAQTADGFIATDDNKRLLISNDFTNRFVHKWRSQEAGIMIGVNTALTDDPLLDNRYWFGQPPVKIVLDPDLKLPMTAKLFQQNRVLIFNTRKEGEEGNVQFIRVDKDNILYSILRKLYELKIQSVFAEGGRKLLQSFIDAGLWDEARIIVNLQLTIGRGLVAPVLTNSSVIANEVSGNDSLSFYKSTRNKFV